jgi:NifU-like protein involved in Fe-S cluster formation/bacterioferritin-associated ferredoxin
MSVSLVDIFDLSTNITRIHFLFHSWYFSKVSSFYSAAINARFTAPRQADEREQTNAIGTAAAPECGTYIQFRLFIDADTKMIESASFGTNGCGFMIAAGDALAELTGGRRLTDLHGSSSGDWSAELARKLGDLPSDRSHCALTSIDALKAAFNDFRSRQIEEFAGEKALICTCFGIPEDTIELEIRHNGALTVEDIGLLCNAGTGCGSCQLMIQEMIDAARHEAG